MCVIICGGFLTCLGFYFLFFLLGSFSFLTLPSVQVCVVARDLEHSSMFCSTFGVKMERVNLHLDTQSFSLNIFVQIWSSRRLCGQE